MAIVQIPSRIRLLWQAALQMRASSASNYIQVRGRCDLPRMGEHAAFRRLRIPSAGHEARSFWVHVLIVVEESVLASLAVPSAARSSARFAAQLRARSDPRRTGW